MYSWYVKRRKKTPLEIAKDKLWELCKTITRLEHGNVCYTCGKPNLEGSSWQTGHFISSSICSTELRYDLSNLRPQCYNCNINKSGNWLAFEQHLTHAHGKDYVTKLKKRNEKTKGKQYDLLWYRDKIEEHKAYLSELQQRS